MRGGALGGPANPGEGAGLDQAGIFRRLSALIGIY